MFMVSVSRPAANGRGAPRRVRGGPLFLGLWRRGCFTAPTKFFTINARRRPPPRQCRGGARGKRALAGSGSLARSQPLPRPFSVAPCSVESATRARGRGNAMRGETLCVSPRIAFPPPRSPEGPAPLGAPRLSKGPRGAVGG